MQQFLWFLLMIFALANDQQYYRQTFVDNHPNAISNGRHQAIPVFKIIKQMNQLHKDGSYTFGFESHDGTFRIETRNPDGITRGKCGFRDDQGVLHEIDYMAGREVGYETNGGRLSIPQRPPPPKRQPVVYEERRPLPPPPPLPQRKYYQAPIQRRPPPRQERYKEEPVLRRKPTRTEAMAMYLASLQRWSAY